ncbi:MAG: hypothetical protein QXU97_05395 [Fervidicoccaceae archaeon]
MGSAICGEKKRPGGKLVKACVELDERGEPTRLLISGDFFVEPEEGYELLEEIVAGPAKSLSALGLERASELLERELRSRGVALIGVEPLDVLEAIARALESSRGGRS